MFCTGLARTDSTWRFGIGRWPSETMARRAPYHHQSQRRRQALTTTPHTLPGRTKIIQHVFLAACVPWVVFDRVRSGQRTAPFYVLYFLGFPHFYRAIQ